MLSEGSHLAFGCRRRRRRLSGVIQFGLPDDLGVLIFGLVWLGLPFVPVWIAASQPRVGDRVLLIAFLVAALSTVVIHRLVQRSIEGDESSTAAVIHIYDPILGCLAVGVVFVAAWATKRIPRAIESDPR